MRENHLTVSIILLSVFYLFFGTITWSVYDLDQIGWLSLFFIPRTFFASFKLFFFYAISLTIASRWNKVYKKLTLFVFPLTLIYAFQYFSLYYSRNYIISEALQEYHAIGIYLNFTNIIKLILFILFGIGTYLLLQKTNKRSNSWLKVVISLFGVFFFFTVTFASYWTTQKLSKHYASSFPRPDSTPEMAFLKLFLPEPKIIKPSFDFSEKTHLEQDYGLKLKKGDYPYSNSSFKEKDYPHTVDSLKAKNIILIFAESLSARFIGSYGAKFDSITPNIDQFSKESLIIKGYYNHTTPTYNGLLGSLCSVYPHFHNVDFENKEQRFKIRSLIDILNENGYSSSMYCYENKGYSLFRLMKKLGFKNLYFKQDIENLYNFKSSRQDYLSDEELFESYIKNFLTQTDTLEPFIHLLSTIETHNGYAISKDSEKYEKHNNSFLSAIHNFDAQFGKFIEWFNSSKYKENTIVILTADHSLPLGADLGSIYEQSMVQNSLFDEIALIIYSPDSPPDTIQVNNSSISLAPTILDLLRIKESQNSFIGQSLFMHPNIENIIGVVSSSTYVKSKNNSFKLSKDSTLLKWAQLNKYLFKNNMISPN